MAIRKRVGADGSTSYGVEVYLPLSRTRQWVGSYRLKRDALLAEADSVRKVKLGESLVKPKEIRFDHLADEWFSTIQVRYLTKLSYEKNLRRAKAHWGRTEVSSIGRRDIELYVAKLCKQGLAPATVHSALTPVRLLFGAAFDWDYIKANPCLRIKNMPSRKRVKEITWVSPGDHQRLVQATDEYHRPLVHLLPFVGLRLSEALGLRWSDIDLDRGRLKVTYQLDRSTHELAPVKTGAGVRTINMPPIAVTILRDWKAVCPKSDLDLVFPSASGTPQIHQEVYYWFNAATTTAKLEGVTPHTMRHTFVAWLLNQSGANIKYIQQQCGHSNIQVTLDTYGSLMRVDDSTYADSMGAWYAVETVYSPCTQP